MYQILLTLLLSSASLAQPSEAVLQRIQESFSPALQTKETSDGYSIALCAISDLEISITDPVEKTPATVQARIYFPAKKASDRSVILLPPTGGENILDRGYANALCAAGFKVALLQTWTNQTESKLELTVHDEGALRALTAIRHVLDYLNPSRPNQVGILGTSVGALSSALALGFDSRLNHGVLVVGGVGLAEIYSTSTQSDALKLREARMSAFGFTSIEEYRAALEKNVTIDPKDFADYSGKKNVLAFVGTEDATVATKNQRDLVQLFGAESVEYNGDHLETILHTAFWQSEKIRNFFEKNLQ